MDGYIDGWIHMPKKSLHVFIWITLCFEAEAHLNPLRIDVSQGQS